MHEWRRRNSRQWANVLLEKEFLFYFKREIICVQYSLYLIDLSLFCYVLIRFENIITTLRDRVMITSCDSVSDTFDRPSWYINRIGERWVTIVARLKIRKKNLEVEREGKINYDAMIIRINRFYTNATEGPKAVFTCWESFGPLWLHVNEWILSETQAKYLFMR